ncbi:hypothetical protein XENOCAPTIV_002202 [Xenoophorus captivus]|uniref:Uncharacterized protein n=1 Tax=Xenoophorus captivus TaxID=1517983 RepID=A0ABV0Q7H8_9TELE
MNSVPPSGSSGEACQGAHSYPDPFTAPPALICLSKLMMPNDAKALIIMPSLDIWSFPTVLPDLFFADLAAPHALPHMLAKKHEQSANTLDFGISHQRNPASSD